MKYQKGKFIETELILVFAKDWGRAKGSSCLETVAFMFGAMESSGSRWW